ncbi:hypothetical protein [Natronorarus salvus]|uniref:hypothetical protein n=1 Tax=Natronorarus salvus TaxID=3117733 RepID=UPI002F260B15
MDHRAVALVVVSSVALTTALIGIIAVFSGAVDGIGGRAPLYFLVTAVAFVALVIGFEKEALDGRTILLSTAGLSVVLGVLTVLVGEGLVYTLRHPASVLTSRLLLSLLAVGVICTGLVYWGLRHWREFLPHHPEG